MTIGLLLTAFALGLRHGVDWDHLAAIGSITRTQTTRRRAVTLATLYAIGHGAVVLVLGVAAVIFAERLPAAADAVMERVVGVSLVVLGGYVLVSIVRHGRAFRMRSRWMLVLDGVRRVARSIGSRARDDLVVIEHTHPHAHDGTTPEHATHIADGDDVVLVDDEVAVAHEHVHEHPVAHDHALGHVHRHRHVRPLPDDPAPGTRVGGALGLGALHGIGVETPTQAVVIVGAAGVSGTGAGLLTLVVFLAGLLCANTGVAGASAAGLVGVAGAGRVAIVFGALTGVGSLVVGTLFATGHAATLTGILGG